MSEKNIDIRLRGEGIVITGTLYDVGDSMPGLIWKSRTYSSEAARWRCPCGTELDTATLTNRLHRMNDGYFVCCPECTRWYFHQHHSGIVEGGRPEERVEDPLLQTMGAAGLCLVGSPTSDLADMPHRLFAAGVNTRPAGVIQDGDYVVFCISCPDGPTPGTQESLTRCAGHRVAPIALVMTRADMVDDDSLLSLVRLEDMELLARAVPRETVERLPVYYDFDPGLPRKLVSRISEGPAIIVCPSAVRILAAE